jgi:hypothetical protein
MNMIVAIIAIVFAALLIYVSTRPDNFRVERSLVIHATAEQLFSLLNDFHAWEAWSPWEKIDPAVKRTYSGAESGIGAIYGWVGNRQLGEGRMEILSATPDFKLQIQIDFFKPFAAQNIIEFTLVQQGDTTTITQAMFGPSNFTAKLMGLCFSMDKMIGSKFDEGLQNIQRIVELKPQ